MEATRVFDGDLLRADVFNPQGENLFVSFRQGVMEAGQFEEARPVRTYVRSGYAHLHVQSRDKDWYINPETPALDAALQAWVKPYQRRVAMGFSMGGYAVLRFSGPLALRRAILVAPQFSISPEVVPFDKRRNGFAEGFDLATGDLSLHGRRRLHGVMLVDPFRRLDMQHVALIREVFPRLHLCRTCGSGHFASRVLREGGHFSDLQRSLMGRTSPHSDITRWHRTSRRGSARYWNELAQIAAKRGREALAHAALDRLADFEDADVGEELDTGT